MKRSDIERLIYIHQALCRLNMSLNDYIARRFKGKEFLVRKLQNEQDLSDKLNCILRFADRQDMVYIVEIVGTRMAKNQKNICNYFVPVKKNGTDMAVYQTRYAKKVITDLFPKFSKIKTVSVNFDSPYGIKDNSYSDKADLVKIVFDSKEYAIVLRGKKNICIDDFVKEIKLIE